MSNEVKKCRIKSEDIEYSRKMSNKVAVQARFGANYTVLKQLPNTANYLGKRNKQEADWHFVYFEN